MHGRAFALQVRSRCHVFFTVACVATIACVVATAVLFRAGQLFLGVTVAWNAAVGLFLTHDVREWPHRLQEVLLYCVFICELWAQGGGEFLQN